MDKAKEVYCYVLKEINGWSDEEINKLSISDIKEDPIFLGIAAILYGGDKDGN